MKDIRNIAFVGASGAGKTSLIEQMLFNAKSTTRVGKVEDGNTVMDFSTEEIEKGISMVLGIGNFQWKNHKINILDVPGSADFTSEEISASIAVENLMFVVNGAAGFEVTLENSFENLAKADKTKSIVVNRMDSEGADYFKSLESGMADQVEETRNSLMEAVAESDDELLEKYFEAGELTDEELSKGIKKAILTGAIIPAFACSATGNVAVNALMTAISEYLPTAQEKNEMTIFNDGEEESIITSEDGELLAYVFKSFSDPNVGDIAYVRVFSGSLKSAMDVYIPEKDSKDKIGSLSFALGKNRKDTDEINAGDIGALVKIKVARSFNTIVPVNSKLSFGNIDLPTPVFWQTIKAVNQSDEDKIGTAVSKLLDEDPTIKLEMNSETNENVLAGIGEQQILLLKKRLKTRYKIDAELQMPSIPYKETIKGKADVSYKHKKQSGGRGQYGEVYFKVNPKPRGEGFEFINSIVGGVIPTKFIPAIEKGLKEILSKGIVCGAQIVDLSVECYYGSFHDVDSSEMAFKIAASQALKKAFEVAKPILLEPIHDLQIVVPVEYMGDVMGDVSTRRGKILGMEQVGKKQILNAQMPLAELFNYFPNLKSLTQGRGKFTQTFSHYEKVPDEIAVKVIAATKSED